jgi:hypothetical protein
MLRSSLIAASAVVLCATSSAQQQVQAQKIISPIRDAGTYHVATGTWTRTGSSANLGADVIYSATAPSGYFGVGWEGGTGVDEGSLPGTGSPFGGSQDCYSVDGFLFSYCCLDVSVDWTWSFYDSYVPCDLVGAPANCSAQAGGDTTVTAPGASACWFVIMDLAGGGEVNLTADGGTCAPGYQGGALGLDSFGIAHVWATPSGGTTGPILDGYDPSWATPGDGTCYNSSISCGAGNTGLGAEDFFAIEGGGLSPGCYWFGGYSNSNGCGGPSQGPGAQFTMEMYTDCAAAGDCSGGGTDCGTQYCDTNPVQNGNIAADNCTLDGSSVNVTVSDCGTALFAYLNIALGSNTFTDPPGSVGDLCLTGNGPIGRYNADLQSPQGSGSYTTDIYNGNTGGGAGNLPQPPGGTLTPGDTWNIQGWQRMPAGGATTWSAALAMTFN